MNKKKFSFLITGFLILLLACAPRESKREAKTVQVESVNPQFEFFSKFQEFEGKKFLGKQVFASEGVSGWEGKEIEMWVREAHDTIIYVPLRVGENRSRTWILLLENSNNLRFRHDHRHEDGTPEDLTMYGGYAVGRGTPFEQVFPADNFTCEMLDRICDNEWTIKFAEDLATMSYILKKAGDLVFQVDIDLTKPYSE